MNMNELLAEQQAQQTKLANLYKNYLAKVKNKPVKGYAESYLQRLETEWLSTKELHQSAMNLAESDFTHPYFTSKLFNSCEESYWDTKGEFLEHLEQFSVRERAAAREAELQALSASRDHQIEILNTSVQQPSRTPLSLAKIELPKFQGSFDQWENFRDLFRSLVHEKEDIPKILKFQYLKTHVFNEALNEIKHLNMIEANYDKAWLALNDKYENQRRIVHFYVSALRSVKPMKNESSAELNRVTTGSFAPIESLEAINRPVKHWDDLLVYDITNLFEHNTRKEWERSLGNSTDPPTMAQLRKFCQTQVLTLESIERSNPNTVSKNQNSFKRDRNKSSSHAQTTEESTLSRKCPCCDDEHALWNCSDFKGKTPKARMNFVIKIEYCIKCLNKHKGTCAFKYNCSLCKKPHNTLLHVDESRRKISKNNKVEKNTSHVTNQESDGSISSSSVLSEDETEDENTKVSLSTNLSPRGGVLLSTALVYVSGPNGLKVLARALIDQCSQVSIISDDLCKKLKLSREKVHIPISGIGNSHSIANSRAVAQFKISPRFKSSFSFNVQAAILPKITSYKPPRAGVKTKLEYLGDLMLADPYYNDDAPIDLLLGSVVHALIVEEKIVRGKEYEPIATSTRLGWILSGNCLTSSNCISIPASFHCMISDETDLNETLQNFWRQEEVPKDKILTRDEQECEDHFVRTHRRDKSGRYIVSLPFKNPDSAHLGDSYTTALRMLKRMEKKFERNNKFKIAYHDFLKEYLKTGHMSLVEADSVNRDEGFFLPHHGVLKPSSTTTKLRIVFNGSAKTSLGRSLNDLLHTGPNLLPNLMDLICHWRIYEFVFAADAEKMFRQVLLEPADRVYQRILWRFSTDEPIQVYELNTATYGLGPSAYQASRVVKQLAADHRSDFPLGAEVLDGEIYMDDVTSGAHTLDEAIEKMKQTIELCKVGGFSLRKWMSNHPTVLRGLDSKLCAADPLSFHEPELSIKVLGISWHPLEDTFHFHVESPTHFDKITKRCILSNIAKLFDPLGWLGPVIIKAKILMQSLWLLKVGWDSPLPDEVVTKWLNWRHQLVHVNKIRIPRWNSFRLNYNCVEIHGFSDASKFAFGAVIYLRVIDHDKVTMSLQLAKSRVAPLKIKSIPRLELLAAELLTKLVHHYVSIMKIKFTATHLWSDSMDTLYWLRDQPARWQAFIAHKCSNILTLMPNAHWHYVKSKQNPADIISRGIDAPLYPDCDLWWKGPDWLSNKPVPWPTGEELEIDVPSMEETLKSFLLVENEPLVPKRKLWDLMDRYSCFAKILRITSYCLRFIVRLSLRIKSKKSINIRLLSLEYFDCKPFVENSTTERPTLEEMNISELLWIYLTQTHHYSREINMIHTNQGLKSKNPLISLEPIMVKGLLRVGGRLSRSKLDPDTQHPLILPDKAKLTQFIIVQAHELALHGGTQVTLATIRRRFWILRGRSTVRNTISKCYTCKRYSNQFNRQLMGNLPEARVVPAFPFEKSGVDFAGPYDIRLSKTRGKGTMKGYVCIFVCMSTRAVHIEAVEDYSTPAFIAAFHRFTARRGHCSEIFSDNGTNFVGADRQLRQLFIETSAQFKEIALSLEKDKTRWNFNPPGAPHCGGLWEAAVKSCKYHLKRLLGEQVFTFVELATLLARIEACLNSRPLLSLTDDPFDPPFLSPSHFLIQRQSYLIPEPDVTSINVPAGRRWQYITQLVQKFWSRWSAEYLTSLQPRGKWRQKETSLQVGDLVILKNETTPPAKWPIGRVIKAEPSKDGLVRVVTIKTPTSTLERHVTKTILLVRPPENTTDESGRIVESPEGCATAAATTQFRYQPLGV